MAFHLKKSSIAEALLAVVLSAAIASCKPVEKKSPLETQETSAGDADAAKTVEDFGPTLLKIAAQYSIEDHDTYSTLSASRYGFVDVTGKTVIEPQWEEVSSFDLEELDKVSGFSEGIALVQRDGKWGWIDKTGRLFLPPFSSPASFHEGLSSFQRDGKWGYMDTTGAVVLQPEWEAAEEFSGGYAAVKRGGKWGGIDKTGSLVLPLGNYEGLYFDSQPGLWRITVGGKWGYMDRTGRVVIKPQQWELGGLWSEGLGIAYRDRKGGFIDRTGKVVVPPEWQAVRSFYEGLAPVQQNEKWGFIDKTGKVVLELRWANADGFHKGLAAVQLENGKWGFIDKTGKVVIEPRWDEVSNFRHELALVKENKKFGFIDRTGRVVIEPQWDVAKYYWEAHGNTEAQNDSEPFYWLVARRETPESGPARSKSTVRVLWLDSAGKQIWSSDNSNRSAADRDALKSPSPSVSSGQDKR